jgi:hypothetical protein
MTDEFGNEFGICKHCDKVARVKVNGTPCCLQHMDQEFHSIGVTVREIVKKVIK